MHKLDLSPMHGVSGYGYDPGKAFAMGTGFNPILVGPYPVWSDSIWQCDVLRTVQMVSKSELQRVQLHLQIWVQENEGSEKKRQQYAIKGDKIEIDNVSIR